MSNWSPPCSVTGVGASYLSISISLIVILSSCSVLVKSNGNNLDNRPDFKSELSNHRHNDTQSHRPKANEQALVRIQQDFRRAHARIQRGLKLDYKSSRNIYTSVVGILKGLIEEDANHYQLDPQLASEGRSKRSDEDYDPIKAQPDEIYYGRLAPPEEYHTPSILNPQAYFLKRTGAQQDNNQQQPQQHQPQQQANSVTTIEVPMDPLPVDDASQLKNQGQQSKTIQWDSLDPGPPETSSYSGGTASNNNINHLNSDTHNNNFNEQQFSSIRFTTDDAQSTPFKPVVAAIKPAPVRLQREMAHEPAISNLQPESYHFQDLMRKQNAVKSAQMSAQKIPSSDHLARKPMLTSTTIRWPVRFGGIGSGNSNIKRHARTTPKPRRQSVTSQPSAVRASFDFSDHITSGSGISAETDTDSELTDNNQSGDAGSMTDADQQLASDRGLTTRASLDNHRSILLQQVNPQASPFYQTSTTQIVPNSNINNQPFRPLMQGSSQQASNLYTIQNGGSHSGGSVKFLTSEDVVAGLKPNALGSQPAAYAVSASQLYPRDLQNQPQTIQITALPNALAGPNQVVRFNGQVGWPNGWFGNQFGYQYDAFGRPLLMNAERRQVDWPTWFYPMIIIMTLPLIIGALFVPVFLKTIIVLLQILQSLGLLLPLTNAMSQHLLQASGLAHSGNGTLGNMHYELPKT